MVDAFRPNPLQPGPLLRGFYFTGTVNAPARVRGESLPGEGSVISDVGKATVLLRGDQVKEEFQRIQVRAGVAAAPAPEPTVERWCFVSELFHAIVQAGPAPVRKYADRRTEVLRRTVFGAAVALCAVLGVLVLWSAWKNHEFLESVDTAASALAAEPLNVREPSAGEIEKLDRLRERIKTLYSYENHLPWSMRFFLYPGSTLIDPARKTWFTYFDAYLRKPLAQRMEASLASLPPSPVDTRPYEPIYGSLKTYLTITAQSCPATPELSPALTQDWGAGAASGADSATVRRQFDFYVSELQQKRAPASQPKEETVRGARRYLGQFGGENRIYRGLIDQVNRTVRRVSLGEYAPAYPRVLAGVDEAQGAFTAEGWAEMQDRIQQSSPSDLGESCVMGTSRTEQVENVVDGSAFHKRLRDMYVADYIRQWKEILSKSNVVTFRNPKDAAEKLDLLQGTDSPLMYLMFMVHENVEAAASTSTDGSQAASKMAAVGKTLGARAAGRSRTGRIGKEIVAGLNQPGNPGEASPPPDPQEAFQPVHSLFTPEAKRTNWNDQKNIPYLHALGELHRAMEDLYGHGDDPERNAAAKTAVDHGRDLVLDMSRSFDRGPDAVDEDVKRLLNQPFEYASKLYVADPGKAAAQKMNGSGAQFCNHLQPLLAKYPFKRDAQTEAGLNEVADVFSPQTGSLRRFFTENKLDRFLVWQGGRYARKSDAPSDVKLDQGFIDSLTRLTRVSKALFADDSGTPGMRYRLTVVHNPDVRVTTLTVDGQSTTGGPQTFTWGNTSHEVKLDLGSNGAPQTVLSYANPWAIFSMMAESDERQAGSPDIWISNQHFGKRGLPTPIVFEGKPTKIEIHIDEFPGGITNAFDRDFFASCGCWKRVAD